MVCRSGMTMSVSPVKTAELTEMSLGMWTWVGPRKHVLDWVHIGSTWRIRLNRSCAAVMRPYAKLLSPLVIIKRDTSHKQAAGTLHIA